MILLKKVRLINWYGFVNETVPIGMFTLIAGKNGNGKSVLLDAVKYAAFGDTVFNKSSEVSKSNKGNRTLSSYTRGLLDATAGSYMRPPEKVPNVYTHIVLEYYDEVEEKPFILGTVIETSPSNNCQSLRYVIDHKTLDEICHTYEEKGVLYPYSAAMLQKEYKVTLMKREKGLAKFLQMMGLKLNISQLPVYLRKLRGIMSYDPDARIDRFIRDSVLEEKNVDFNKLIEAKENIVKLNEMFNNVESEIQELDQILKEYDTIEMFQNRLLADDIRLVYRDLKQLKEKDEKIRQKKVAEEEHLEDLRQDQGIIEARRGEVDHALIQAQVSLLKLDSTQMIQTEENRLKSLQDEYEKLKVACRRLEGFQKQVIALKEKLKDIRGDLNEQMEGQDENHQADDPILVALCHPDYTAAQKTASVLALKQLVDSVYDQLVEKNVEVDQALREIGRQFNHQIRIIEECKKHSSSFSQIPDYVGLKEEINKEFAKRGLKFEAKFACEYVIRLEDEDWRNALEGFLGRKRYTILVDPQGYDIADAVFNRTKYREAHLFNTKLLMRKSLHKVENSAADYLIIKNPVARQYFDYQLGRMHAVSLDAIRNYENAIAKEGRVSVAMDSYFLHFDKIRSYYLGQKTFELNRKRAEQEVERLKASKVALQKEKVVYEGFKKDLMTMREVFDRYDYDVHSRAQSLSKSIQASQTQLDRLKRAQKNNQEYLELIGAVEKYEKEKKGIEQAYSRIVQEKAEAEQMTGVYTNQLDRLIKDLSEKQKDFKRYEADYPIVVQQTLEAYDRFVKDGEKGTGGPLKPVTRDRIGRNIEQHKSILFRLQGEYNVKHPDLKTLLEEAQRAKYAARKEKIWMDSLQEIRMKLNQQTRQYEEIFKNEFVLTILKSCERAREDLKQINRELARLKFASKYEFDVRFVQDGSDYAKVLEYARYLNEREQLGKASMGQMTLESLVEVSNEEGQKLENEMKAIITKIIESNSEEMVSRFADYRNYMTYEILMTNEILHRSRLSRQTGYNSGAEVQIPYLLILSAALLMIYNQRVNVARLVFIDEPFAKMDAGNIKLMLAFMKEQKLQLILCSPDKTEVLGEACEVVLPVVRESRDSMRIGVVQFHEERGL